MHRAALALAFAAALLAVPAGNGTSGAGPVTLVETEAPIYAFAQDGGWIAWIRRLPGGPLFTSHAAVFARAAAGGPVIRLTPRPEVGDTYGLVLGAGRALWWAGYETMSTWTVLGTAAVGDRRTRRPAGGVRELDACDGSWVSAVAADGARLVYSILASEEGEEFSCVGRPGHTARVVSGRGRRLPGVTGTSYLALAGRTLAIAHAARAEVRDADSGRLRKSFDLDGEPAAIALGSDYLAAILRGSSPHLQVRDLGTGEVRGSVPLRGRWGWDISASGSDIVYSIGRAIHALDATTLRSRRVAFAATAPIDLSIEGRRIAWAENARGRGWIKALTLAERR